MSDRLAVRGEKFSYEIGTEVAIRTLRSQEVGWRVFVPVVKTKVHAIELYPYENGRVDVVLEAKGATIKWSSLFHVESVGLGLVLNPGEMLKMTLRNVSMDPVLLRAKLTLEYV